MERAIARNAKHRAMQAEQTDHSAPTPAPIITKTVPNKAVTSKRMSDEEYQVVILSKMKAHIQNRLTAVSNNPPN
jgi:hypothetical protein